MRASNKEFKKMLKKQFGESFADKCWLGDEVQRILKIRNRLAHAGGRYSTELDKWKKSLHVHQNVLQIKASDIRNLHETLKSNVDVIINSMINKMSKS